ncbi:unnamed protein product, partial [Phaeothamnion confervicola]
MFLCEAALGCEATIMQDKRSLTREPAGHDSAVVRGRREPPATADEMLVLNDMSVAVPQAGSMPMPAFAGSSFMNSRVPAVFRGPAASALRAPHR